MNEYTKLDGTKGNFLIKKDISLSSKKDFVSFVAENVVSKQDGYIDLLFEPFFNFCLILNYTDIKIHKEKDFCLDYIDEFCKINKENVIDKIIKSIGEDTYRTLKESCNKAVEYKLIHDKPIEKELRCLFKDIKDICASQKSVNDLIWVLSKN